MIDDNHENYFELSRSMTSKIIRTVKIDDIKDYFGDHDQCQS